MGWHDDLRAIELYVAAGSEPAACVVALERLAQVALDDGRVDAVALLRSP